MTSHQRPETQAATSGGLTITIPLSAGAKRRLMRLKRKFWRKDNTLDDAGTWLVHWLFMNALRNTAATEAGILAFIRWFKAEGFDPSQADQVMERLINT